MRASWKPVFFLALSSVCCVAQTAPQRPAITGIAFFRVYSTHPAEAQHFYGDTLGYSVATRGDVLVYPVSALQWIEVLTGLAPTQPNVRMDAVGFMTRDAGQLEVISRRAD